ncbi:hypothetical protein SLA2020_444230 [Shorea laevis]
MEASPRAEPQLPQPRVSEEMEAVHTTATEEDPSSDLWDFGALLDFTVDDHFSISLDPDHPPRYRSRASELQRRIRTFRVRTGSEKGIRG